MPTKQRQANMRVGAPRNQQLVEREQELARLGDALDDAGRGSGSVIFIESPAGTGRSSLLAAAGDLAAQAGARVLRASGRATERAFRFGLALQLFEDQLLSAAADVRVGPTSGPSELARKLSRRPSDGETQFIAIHELFWAARNLTSGSGDSAEGRPLALLVDDAHNADAASLQFLAYTAARVPELPIALLVTCRSGERATDAGALTAIQAAAATVLRPAELSLAAAAELARATFPDAEPSLWTECAELTGGNPFLLRALLDDVRRTRSEAPGSALEDAELVPHTVVAMVRTRLSAHTPAERSTASAAAVLGEGASLSEVAAVAGLDLESASRAADALADAQLLRGGAPLYFTSTLLRRAVHRSIPSLERELLERRAGRSAASDAGRGQAFEHIRLAHMAIDGSARGDHHTRVGTLAELAWEHGAQWAEVGDPTLAVRLAEALLLVDELELGLQILGGGADASPAGPGAGQDQTAACCRAWLLYHRGEIASAATTAREALGTGTGMRHSLQGVLAACHIELGRLDEAEAALAMLHAPGGVAERDLALLFDVRAQLALARQRPADALADALEAGRRAQAVPGAAQPGRVAWRSTAALAQIALNEPAGARQLAEEELERARSHGVTRVSVRALRILGRASAGRQRLDLLEEAVALGAETPVRLEYLHALVDLGAATRRANRRAAARESLIKALELARGFGATAVADRAQEEMSTGAGRRRRPRTTGMLALTPSERRVALMAARGLTTRQIAAELFVTPKTVEFHLRHVYRKLEVPSTRAELTRALLGEDATAAGSDGAGQLELDLASG